jgi:hypothetical protein
LRGAAVAALAVAVAVPVTASPAQAWDGYREVWKVGEVSFNLFLDARNGELTEEQIVSAMQEFIGAVEDGQNAILRAFEALGSSPWVGAAQHALLEVDTLPNLTLQSREDYALEVALHARMARSVFNNLSGPSVYADSLGVAVYTLYAVGLEARLSAGFGTTTYMPDYKAAMKTIVDKLQPVCDSGREGELDFHPMYYHVVYSCTIPTGGSAQFQDFQVNGVWQDGPWTPQALVEAAGANTSWALAKAMLQSMERQGL